MPGGSGGGDGGGGGGRGGSGGAGGDGGAFTKAELSSSVRSLKVNVHVALRAAHGVRDCHRPSRPGRSSCACIVQHASTRICFAHCADEAKLVLAPGGHRPDSSIALCTSMSIIEPNFFSPSIDAPLCIHIL